ncbi:MULTISPECIES: S1 family peptidase [unclassified Streptomyces]|uniref:S1 family peptidase n=1 Tax=unclassified Streptomyces TaxID=2593676 RepID=UPI003FA36E91
MECTAQVRSTRAIGTGFFVAPGRLITCAHVVAEASRIGEALTVEMRDMSHSAHVRVICPPPPELPAQLASPYPWPDMACLEIDYQQHRCVQLDPREPSLAHPATEGWAWGYTDRFQQSIFRPSSARFIFEGPADIGDGRRWTLKSGQASPGMSGAPLLNQDTHQVFGMVTRTRDAASDLGAWAVPIVEAMRVSPGLSELLDLNLRFHESDKTWQNALARSAQQTVLRPSIVWVNSGDPDTVSPIIGSAVDMLTAQWPPNEISVTKVRFASRPGAEADAIDKMMARVSAAIIIVDDESPSASCVELAEAAARGGIPTIVLSKMDLDWYSKGLFEQLGADHAYSFEYGTYQGESPIQAVVAYLNRTALQMDRMDPGRRRGNLRSIPMRGR